MTPRPFFPSFADKKGMEHPPNRNRRRLSHGFTLVELLVVVVVLIVVAAIAVPIFLNQKTKAEMAVASSEVAAVASAFATGQATNGTAVVGGKNVVVTDGSGATVTVPLGGTTVVSSGAVVNPVNNVLTETQASFEGGTVSGITFHSPGTSGVSSARATAGTQSLRFAPDAGQRLSVSTSSSRPAVQPSKTYTFAMDLYVEPGGTHTTPWRMLVYFYNSSGSQIGGYLSQNFASQTVGAWTTATLTTVTPPGTATASITAYQNVTPAGTVFYMDKWGVWPGSSTVWALPNATGSLALTQGTDWCVVSADPTTVGKFIRQRSGTSQSSSVSAANATAACAA